jgi:hypothetical protein
MVLVSLVTACSIGSSSIDLDPADKGRIQSLDCSRSWANCYAEAKTICGARGYDEVDRVQRGNVTAMGQPEEYSANHDFYRGEPGLEVQDRVLTIRCK